MHAFSVFAQTSDTPFDWSQIGLAGIFLGMLGFLAKKYWEREQQFDKRIDALIAKCDANHEASEEKYTNLVREGNDTLKGLAVVLNGVQTGMAQQVERAAREGPTPDQMLRALQRLEQTTDALNQHLNKRGE